MWFDLQTILIGLLVFFVSAFVIYFISKFQLREKTYEEVMAEEKKRREEEREKLRSEKKMEKEQLKKKYKKGKGDKAKEKAAQVSEPELPKDSPSKTPKKEHKMVNLELEPEIIEPFDNLVLSSTHPRNRTGARKKSILHNKDEITPIAEKAVELPHKPIKPLDDLELKKLHDSQAHAHDSPAKNKKDKGQPQAEPKQDVKETVKEVKEVKVQKVKATRVEMVEAQQAPADEEKKLNKAKTAGDATVISGARLVEVVRATNLSESEVQTLIEILLNRSGATAASQESWNKKSQKGDPMMLLKKQLEEKERALQEEQQLAMASNTRAKELRNELTVERSKTASLEKHFQEKLAMQQAELEALQNRLRHTHEQHMIESSKMQARMQQLEQSGDAALLQKLKQENRILQDSLSKASTEAVPIAEVNNLRQKVSIMEKELSSNAVRLNAAENAKKSSEEKLKKYEEQMKKLESTKKGSEDVLAKKLEEVSAELRKAENKNGQLSSDLKKATGAVSSAESECVALKTKLQELEKHLSAVDASKETTAKLQASLQDAERKKQELEGNLKNLEKQLTDYVQRQDTMAAELQTVRQENESLTQEVKVTKEKAVAVAAAAPPAATNGDIHTNNKDLMQIAEHERLMAEKVAELTKLQSELDVSLTAASQVAELKAQLDAQKQKNNELREKNWKAMEALEKAEKSAAEKVNKSDKSSRDAVLEIEKSDKEVLKRLFPAITVNDKLSHKEWLVTFEKQAAQHVAQIVSTQHSEKDRVKELEEENRKLQHQSENHELKFTQLNADNERLRHLEEENQRLKSSSSASTSALAEEVSRLKEDKQALQSRLEEKENSIAEVEKKLENLEKVVESEEKKWKEKLRQAEESISKGSDSSREQELEELTIKQQEQIEHYRNVLANTEIVLQRLESAEQLWEDKLHASNAELQQVKSDYERVQADYENVEAELQSLRGSTEDLSDLGFAYRCVEKSLTSIIDEMQGKIEGLETELRQSSEKLNTLTRDNEVLTSKVIVLETQSRAIVQLDTEDLRKRLEEIQKQLEQEQKKGKDLSSTIIRLNGIIKTGQDALTQEQKLVQQLKEQLTDKTKGSGTSANQEIEQGQLGVLGTSGNETGTSV